MKIFIIGTFQVRSHSSVRCLGVTGGSPTQATARSTCTCTPRTSLTTATSGAATSPTPTPPVSGSTRRSTPPSWRASSGTPRVTRAAARPRPAPASSTPAPPPSLTTRTTSCQSPAPGAPGPHTTPDPSDPSSPRAWRARATRAATSWAPCPTPGTPPPPRPPGSRATAQWPGTSPRPSWPPPLTWQHFTLQRDFIRFYCKLEPQWIKSDYFGLNITSFSHSCLSEGRWCDSMLFRTQGFLFHYHHYLESVIQSFP